MIDSLARSEIVLTLAEEFLDRYRKGERPRLREYIDRHPELAGEIREVFPAMAMMEKIAIVEESPGDGAGRPAAVSALEQFGDYRIVREIGRGGMGIVYEAEQVSLGRHVALKVLRNKALLDVGHKRRFDREAKSAAKLHHTNIVPVFGIGEQDGLSYYVMQFIQGLGINEVLAELIRQQGNGAAASRNRLEGQVSATDLACSLLAGKLHVSDETVDQRRGEEATEDRASAAVGALSDSSVVLPGQGDAPASRKQTYWQSIANIGVQVASALDHAHNHGVLHRDIKPSNLLLDRRGTVWVTDFGLAKSTDQADLTHTGDVVGTLLYMPPEAFEGKADCRGDVYSLGLTLYELLAMRPAFSEKDRNRLIHQVTTMEPARLDKLNPAIPRDLVTIIHKAIERHPAHRYTSAAELGADLRRFLDDEPIQARPISGLERLWRWCRRRPAQAAAAAFALLLLAALVALPLALAVSEARNSRALAKEKLKVDEALKQAHRQAAVLALERALGVCEQGDVAHGLLLLARGLAKAREAEADDLEQAFRWNLGAWSRENHELLRVLNHGADVLAVAFSPDSKLVATAGTDNAVRVWDAATGLSHGVPLVHPGRVQALAVLPDGKLLTGCDDGGARLWDLVSGVQVGPTLVHYRPDASDGIKKSWPFGQGISSVAFSPDGRVIATGGFDGFIKRWEPETGRPVGNPFAGNSCCITAVAFHPTGRYLLAAGIDRSWRLWDTVTEKTVSSKNTGSNIWAVAFDPLGSKFATGLGQERGARQWPMPEVATAGALGRSATPKSPNSVLLRHYEAATAVAYTPDARLLLTGSHDRTAKFWDTISGQPVGSTLQHRDFVHTVAVSPDNQLALTGSKDGTARLWRIARGSKMHTLNHPGWVRGGPTFDRESKTVLTGGDGLKLVRWDVTTGRLTGPAFFIPPRPGDGWVTGIAISPDGKTVYAADHARGVVHFWDAGTGRHVGQTQPHGDEVWSLALSPDGKTLLTGTVGYLRGPGRGARLWDATTGRPIGAPLEHADGVFGLSFHPDGKTVLTGSLDRTTRLWNAATGQPLGLPLVHPNAIKAAAFRHDGLAVALGSADRTAQVWDPATWTPVGPAMQHDGEVNCVAYNPQGDLLLTASTDFTARIWHVATGRVVGPALRHTSDVTAVSCSPDGRSAATVSDDHTAGLWSMPVPITADPAQIWEWAQRITGQTLGEDGAFHVLSPDEVALLGSAGVKEVLTRAE